MYSQSAHERTTGSVLKMREVAERLSVSRIPFGRLVRTDHAGNPRMQYLGYPDYPERMYIKALLPESLYISAGTSVHTEKGKLATSFLKYWDALDQVERWKGGDQPISPTYKESNLHHTKTGIYMIYETAAMFPRLARRIGLVHTADYFLLHDGGEIGLPHDEAQSDPIILNMTDAEKQEYKGRKGLEEIQRFKSNVLPLFDDHHQSRIYDTYSQYMGREKVYTKPPNTAALCAKLFDVLAGSQVASGSFYSLRIGYHHNTPIAQERMGATYKAIMTHLDNVYRALTVSQALTTDEEKEWVNFSNDCIGHLKFERYPFLPEGRIFAG